ncbi:hypothetical protein Anapl_00075 [Anas platyrhynchos]|uniref:Uncharacterized protein n=1 Tax=Anas platyrhynchos TaxID=8839 RepID=R0LPV4_ANAPL|nr:hypothetical protein Anapl_00075 [Anas platyrhynchos]
MHVLRGMEPLSHASCLTWAGKAQARAWVSGVCAGAAPGARFTSIVVLLRAGDQVAGAGPVLSTVELLVQWKHHNLLRENISLYPHKTSNTCLEGFLHPWLLTCKCKKRRKKIDVIKRKGGTALNSSGAVGNLKPPLAVGALPTLLELCPPGRTCLESFSGWAQLGSAPSEELRHQVRRQEPTLTMSTAESGAASLGLCCFDLVPHRHFCSFRSLAESHRLVPTGAQY